MILKSHQSFRTHPPKRLSRLAPGRILEEKEIKMMRAIAVLALLGCAAAQLAAPRSAVILRSESENQGDGNFRYNYETSNGISADATGYIKNPNARSEDQIQVIQGSYSYYGPDGVLYTVTYIADENGFQPQGAHLPALPVRAVQPQQPYRPARPYNQRFQ